VRRYIRFIQCITSHAFIDCKLAVQLATVVYQNFGTEFVSGELMCSLTDIRTKLTTWFNAHEHFLHVYSVPSNNFAGEDYDYMSNRGRKAYQPVIVAARYPPFARDVQIFNLRSSYTVHCIDTSLPVAAEGDVVPRELWVNGVSGLLFARVMIFESPNEAE
jgi:hypothetical protein